MSNTHSLSASTPATPKNLRPANARATAHTIKQHSRRVAVLRWMLPVCCLAIIAVFLYTSGVFQNLLNPPLEEALPIVSEKTVEMVQPRMSGVDKKEQAYELTAETAKQNIDDPTKVTLENITGSLELNSQNDKIAITAKSGFLDTEANFLQLREKINVTSNQGYSAVLVSVDAKLKEKYITSNDPVFIDWEGGSINANGLEVKDQGNVIRFLNRVRVKITPKSVKKDIN